MSSWRFVSLTLLSLTVGATVWNSQSWAQEPDSSEALPVTTSITDYETGTSATSTTDYETGTSATSTTDAETRTNAADSLGAETDALSQENVPENAAPISPDNGTVASDSSVNPPGSATVTSPEQHSSAVDLRLALNDYFANNPALANCLYGAYIKVLDSERVLYSCHGSVPLAPASNLKILTTATAFAMLGPDFRFSTEVWGVPVNAQGIVAGDIYLRGNGDPTNTPPYWETGKTMYEQIANQLWEQGVREITGDVVGDDSCFDREYYPQGWADHYHLDSYSAPVAGLSLNGNLVDVRVTDSGASTYPDNDYFLVSFDSSGASNTAVERERGSREIKVRGPLSTVNRAITVDNPPMFAASAFAKVLQQRGIKIDGTVRLIRSIGEPASVATKFCYAKIESPSLKEIITEINQQSDNYLAEHVFKTIGLHYAGQGSAATGQAAIEHFMAQNGIDTEGLKLVDGCGLSELNRVTPAQLVDTLIAIANTPLGQVFEDSLASNEHGTLRYRIPGADVHAKTGTLERFTALSGYVPNAQGQKIAFSLVFNNMDDISVGIDIQNKIVTLLAQSGEVL